jgi:Family of unknown function (DUF6790)
MSRMSESKFSELLIFFIANYFLTFLIIGLVAAVISLINKPKPLRINVVAEALFSYYLLFTIGISNLINFVVHVFFGDIGAKFIGWEQSPFQAKVGFASLGVGIAGVIAFKASLPFRFATLIPPSGLPLGSRRRAHLSDDSGEKFLAGQRGSGSPNELPHSDYRIHVFVAVL